MKTEEKLKDDEKVKLEELKNQLTEDEKFKEKQAEKETIEDLISQIQNFGVKIDSLEKQVKTINLEDFIKKYKASQPNKQRKIFFALKEIAQAMGWGGTNVQ